MTKDELIALINKEEMDSSELIDVLTEYINDKDITAAINKLYE